jgi:hypothetical protein
LKQFLDSPPSLSLHPPLLDLTRPSRKLKKRLVTDTRVFKRLARIIQ